MQYDLGSLLHTAYLEEGYEDFNIKVTTSTGRYALKLFANNQLGDSAKSRRGPDVVERLVSILTAAESAHINSPRLKIAKNNEKIFRYDDEIVGVLYDWIEGTNYFENNTCPTESELAKLIEQIARFNQISLHPEYYHDIWAAPHFKKLFSLTEEFLTSEDKKLLNRVAGIFDTIPFNNLPKCLVHGDLTKGNVIRTPTNEIFIIDFSVTIWTTRILDLGLIISNLMHDMQNYISLDVRVSQALELYQKYNKLTEIEVKQMRNLALCCGAMEFTGGVWRQHTQNDKSEETEYWLNLGREGISRELK